MRARGADKRGRLLPLLGLGAVTRWPRAGRVARGRTGRGPWAGRAGHRRGATTWTCSTALRRTDRKGAGGTHARARRRGAADLRARGVRLDPRARACARGAARGARGSPGRGDVRAALRRRARSQPALHTLVLDGAYVVRGDRVEFVRIDSPSDGDVVRVTDEAVQRLARLRSEPLVHRARRHVVARGGHDDRSDLGELPIQWSPCGCPPASDFRRRVARGRAFTIRGSQGNGELPRLPRLRSPRYSMIGPCWARSDSQLVVHGKVLLLVAPQSCAQ